MDERKHFPFPPFFRLLVVVIVAAIISITFYYSLKLALPEISPATSCTFPAPLSGIFNDSNCSILDVTANLISLSSPSIYSQREISAALLNSSQRNEALASNSQNSNASVQKEFEKFLIGNWSFTGYHSGNIISAKVDLDSNNFYISQGIMQVDKKNQAYRVNGTYKLAEDRMLLYFVSSDGVQSAYLLEDVKQDSFYAFNPNSLESYIFLRISSNRDGADSATEDAPPAPSSETSIAPESANGGNGTITEGSNGTITEGSNGTITEGSNGTINLEAARRQYLSAWSNTTFGSQFDAFIEEAPSLGYGIYREHNPPDVFKPGEAIMLYVEPVGFGHKPIITNANHDPHNVNSNVTNTLYLINMTADYMISDSNGTELDTARDIPILTNLTSHRQNTELFLTLKPMHNQQSSPSYPIGDYNITYIIYDRVSGEKFQIEKTIKIADDRNSNSTSIGDHIVTDGNNNNSSIQSPSVQPHQPAPQIVEEEKLGEQEQTDCRPSYRDVCIPLSQPDPDCDEISYRNFGAMPADSHRFVHDNDDTECENRSNQPDDQKEELDAER